MDFHSPPPSRHLVRCNPLFSINHHLAVAIVVATLLRHKTTRKLLPQNIQALWEPLRKVRKSRLLKLKACVLIDLASWAAWFHPMLIKVPVPSVALSLHTRSSCTACVWQKWLDASRRVYGALPLLLVVRSKTTASYVQILTTVHWRR